MSTEPPPTNLRIAAIRDALARLSAGQWAARVTASDRADDLDQIIGGINQLAEEMERRFEELLDVISAMAALDFSKRAPVGGAGTTLDTLSFGINMLSEELVVSTVSKAYVDNVIESLLDSLVVVNPDGTIQSVNRAAAQLFGYPKEELIGRRLDTLLAEAEFTKAVIDAAIHQAVINAEETTCQGRDGRTIPVSFSVSAMVDAGGALQGRVCVVRDITAQKAVEEALRLSIVQEGIIRTQQAALAELSTPLLPITDQILSCHSSVQWTRGGYKM